MLYKLGRSHRAGHVVVRDVLNAQAWKKEIKSSWKICWSPCPSSAKWIAKNIPETPISQKHLHEIILMSVVCLNAFSPSHCTEISTAQPCPTTTATTASSTDTIWPSWWDIFSGCMSWSAGNLSRRMTALKTNQLAALLANSAPLLDPGDRLWHHRGPLHSQAHLRVHQRRRRRGRSPDHIQVCRMLKVEFLGHNAVTWNEKCRGKRPLRRQKLLCRSIKVT